MAKPVVVTKKSPWEGLRRVTSLTDVRLVEGQGPWNDGKVNVDAIVNSQPSCVDLKSLPPVATCVVLVLILIYNMAERWEIEEETQVAVSWKKVVTEKEVWRILVAHFFHFSRVNFMINVTSLMALGRYLERKIRPIPMLFLMLLMGILANVFHMVLCTYICETPEEHRTSGFSHVVFALKMVQVLSKDSGKRRGPTLLLGVLPVYLGSFAFAEPLFEGVLSDVLVKGKHFATHVSGILAGLCFPLLDFFFHEWILVPSQTNVTFSASSGSQGEVTRGDENKSSSEEELGRSIKAIKLLTEAESRVQLFQELPSNECILLFYRNIPMKETSVHDQHSSKSDSYLFLKGKD